MIVWIVFLKKTYRESLHVHISATKAEFFIVRVYTSCCIIIRIRGRSCLLALPVTGVVHILAILGDILRTAGLVLLIDTLGGGHGAGVREVITSHPAVGCPLLTLGLLQARPGQVSGTQGVAWEYDRVRCRRIQNEWYRILSAG